MLGHNSRHQGYVSRKQLVRHPVHENGKQPGVAKDNLVKAFRSGISVIVGADISGQPSSHYGYSLYEGQGFLSTLFHTAHTRPVNPAAFVPNASGDLSREHFEESDDFMPEIILKTGVRQFLPSEIAGKQHVLQNTQYLYGFIFRGDERGAHMINGLFFGARRGYGFNRRS
jgi:hypothetical protein